jgi:hypothetical protein
MNTRPLLIDDDARERAARIVRHAEEHHYIPGEGVTPPGLDDNFCGMFNTFRVVFSITRMGPIAARHLSVSVPGEHYPNPYAVFTLAELFGFTGWDGRSERPPKTWAIGMEEAFRAVIVVQYIPEMVH